MGSVGEMAGRKDMPALARFERRAVEDRAASAAAGRYVARDVDYALVTPPYSRDVFEQVAVDWLAQMEAEARNGRLPRDWLDKYKESYERWKRGEEAPLDGTPIKGWAVLSPAQQKNLIALNILTVEYLASVNDEGMRRIGMGAVDLRDKAKAWLSQSADKGPLTMENAALKVENATLKGRVETLETQVKELAARLEMSLRAGPPTQTVGVAFSPATGITAADLLADDDPQEPPRRGPGRPRKVPESAP